MKMSDTNSVRFLELFAAGEVDAARNLLDRAPDLEEHLGYTAHPLLREFVDNNGGRCDKPVHLTIAELLIPDQVIRFRDAVLNDRTKIVQEMLAADVALVAAEFTAGRGIAQAIHHWNSTNIAEILLDAGADINALTSVQHIGDTPLSLKLRVGSVDSSRFLLERGANPNRGLLKHMPSKSMPELMPLLIEHGWDINEAVGGRTLLHHDANHGHGSRIQTLLKHGADPNKRTQDGQTALHLLAKKGIGAAAIRALIDAGADINSKDDHDQTPLDLANLATRKAASKVLIEMGGKTST